MIFPLCGLFCEVVVMLCVALCCVLLRCVVCYVLLALLGMELELRGSSDNVGTIECVVLYVVLCCMLCYRRACCVD